MSDETTVMIAEDDSASRQTLARLLRRRGYRVVETSDGTEAARLSGPEVQIVVLDWMTPNVDGVELCRHFKSHQVPGYRYVIVVTARTEEQDLAEALVAGADDYVVKPVDHEELMARIRAGERIVRLQQSLAEVRQAGTRESNRDSLTGLYDRMHFDQRLEDELRRACRGSSRLALLMLDLDHFARINESYGEAVGDRVLQEVARLIAAEVRHDVDIPARYGGEEFAVIAPETNRIGARSLADRIRGRVAELRVPAGQQRVSITLSVGIAVFDPRVDRGAEGAGPVIAQADSRLCQAKHGGRNRVAG
jgi:two-component system cell cycle response regulator